MTNVSSPSAAAAGQVRSAGAFSAGCGSLGPDPLPAAAGAAHRVGTLDVDEQHLRGHQSGRQSRAPDRLRKLIKMILDPGVSLGNVRHRLFVPTSGYFPGKKIVTSPEVMNPHVSEVTSHRY